MKLIEKQQLIENTAARTNNGKGAKIRSRLTLSIASKREKIYFHAIERINGNNKNMFL